MLEPRSVAVVGASARAGSFGERLAVEALRSPSSPRVHLVHPSYPSVQGVTCLPSLADVPEPVDLVLLGVPDEALAEEVGLAVARGDGGAVVFGAAVGMADALRAAAGDMPLIGGGCMGFVNVARGVRALGYLEPADLPVGPIALVTHSGSVFSALLRTHRRLEYSVAVSSGQELVTTTADYLDYALGMPETKVVGLFLETMRDVPRLRAALENAAAADVPVVALSVGSSTTGGSLVGAHSGALAGADGAWEALFRAYGVHRAADLDELVDTMELFAVGRRVRHAAFRPGLATVHDSGGERVLAADLAERHRVPFAALSVETTARLADVLDAGLTPGNPLDVWGTGADTEELLTACLTTLAADPAVGVTAMSVDLVEEYDGDDSYAKAVLRAHAQAAAPVAVLAATAAAVHQGTAQLLRGAGIPVLEGMTSGIRALGHLLDAAVPVRPQKSAASRRAVGPLQRGQVATFDLLASYGIPVAETRQVTSSSEAVAAAHSMGFPVALKTATLAHKTEADGVRLDLRTEDAVASAYAALSERLGAEVLVQAMAAPGIELAMGTVRDPHLGPLVILGVGGTLVELVAERVVALPPFDEPTALALLDEVPRISALLSGVRGAERVDRCAVAAVLANLSRLAADLGDGVDAIDVNPLLCSAEKVIAVDALLILPD